MEARVFGQLLKGALLQFRFCVRYLTDVGIGPRERRIGMRDSCISRECCPEKFVARENFA